MNWKDITVSADNTHFLINEDPIFGNNFIDVLKFHSPGLAPVRDNTGAYHIDGNGKELDNNRYSRTFGFYCNRAAVIVDNHWFHINEKGERAYSSSYIWAGNYQENTCTVRDLHNHYFHIDLNGNRIYADSYVYAGDFKDGIACVKSDDGFYRHIDKKGYLINGKSFNDLGIFHKSFATAKDIVGWFHIDRQGNELYNNRFLIIEPFYNGFALVTTFENDKIIIDEVGCIILKV